MHTLTIDGAGAVVVVVVVAVDIGVGSFVALVVACGCLTRWRVTWRGSWTAG